VCDVDALGDEGEEALEGVDLVGVETGVEELGDGSVVGVIVEVRVGAHPPHHPRGRRAARLKSEHPVPAGRAGPGPRWIWISPPLACLWPGPAGGEEERSNEPDRRWATISVSRPFYRSDCFWAYSGPS